MVLNFRDMNIVEKAKKIANLLYKNGCNGSVYFEIDSYDDERYMPKIKVGERDVLVSGFNINESATEIVVRCYDGESYSLSIDNFSNEQACLDLLFKEVYFATPDSHEIGDYDIDFLGA